VRTEGEVEFVAEARETAPRKREFRVSWMVAVPIALGFIVVGVAAAKFLMGPGYGAASGPGGIPIIEPDPTPTKTKPDNPGGMEVPNQDKLVYERLRNAKFEPSVERLLPPEEEPLPRPVVVPRSPDPAIVARQPVVSPIQPPEPQPTVPAPVVAAPQPAPAPVKPAPSVQTPPPVAATPPAPKPLEAAATPALQPKPAALPVVPPAPAASAAKPVGSGLGGWRVQVASVRSEEEAKSESRRLAAKAAAELGGAALQVERADLGDKGIYYRVRSGGMDETTARETCRKLQASGVGCVLVRP